MPTSTVGINNAGKGYTVARILQSLPSSHTWNIQGDTGPTALYWSNVTVDAEGTLQTISMTYPNDTVGSENDDTPDDYSATRTIVLLSPDNLATETYGTVSVKSGQSVIGTSQNGAGADAEQIAIGLANGAPAGSMTQNNVPSSVSDAFNIRRIGTTVAYIRKNGTNTFGFNVSDGLGGKGLGKVFKEVSSLEDLPTTAIDGFKVAVTGNVDENQDDYYVEFTADAETDFGMGTWSECVGFSTKVGLDKSTMPMKLVSTGFDANGVDQFSLEEIEYTDRIAGDGDSNPAPSFVDNKISNMFYFKDRLAFLSNENVILSEVSKPFNFYRTSVTSLLDSDTIDVAAASGRVTNLKAAVGFQENLVLFAENGQFVLKGGTLLTPKTVSINPITNFSYEARVSPLPLGSYIYYPFERGAYSGMREFTVNATSDTYDSAEITEHVPAYIPKNIISVVGSTTEDIIAVVSSDERDAIYMYNFFYNNNKKVLSSWNKFKLQGDIVGVTLIKSDLHIVSNINGKTQLSKMALESRVKNILPDGSEAPFNIHLDSRILKSLTAGDSTIDISSNYEPEDNTIQVYTVDGNRLSCTNSGSAITLSNPVAADVDVYVGYPYTMKYVFSEQVFKDKTKTGSSVSNATQLMIRNGSLYFNDTGYFNVTVTPHERDPYVTNYSTITVDSSNVGDLDLKTGFFRFPIFTNSKGVEIKLENDSALPSAFQSAEFESFANSRSQRYG